MKIISSKLHGILDYFLVLFLIASPTLFNLPETTVCFTYVLAGVHFVLTIATHFEVGLIKVLPLKIHGWIELIVSLALVGVAFYLGDKEGEIARNFYLCFTAMVFITWLLTDYSRK